MKKLTTIVPSFALISLLAGCGDSAKEADHGHEHTEATKEEEHGHPHAEPTNEEHGHEHAESAEGEGHDEAVFLGKFDIDGISVEAAQGHGSVKAGKESHLVLKLPYQDDGETIVRAWIGVADRTLSAVGKGDFTASHGGYDIHAVAPDPLTDGSQWWLEIEKPDGTKAVGSFALLKDHVEAANEAEHGHEHAEPTEEEHGHEHAEPTKEEHGHEHAETTDEGHGHEHAEPN